MAPLRLAACLCAVLLPALVACSSLPEVAARQVPADAALPAAVVQLEGRRGPLTTGNQVRLLQDGPATYAAMLAAI